MRKPSPALLVACVALFVALGGPATAAKLISGSKIKPNSVTSRQIRNRTLTSSDIAKSTLASLKARTGTVTSSEIEDGTIALADMGFGSVTGNQVADHSLSAIDLTANTLTGGEIATAAITADELAPDSVLNAKLKDSVVTKTKLASDAVAASEVRDSSLTVKDVGQSSGSLTTTIANVAPQTCAQQDIPTTGVIAASVVLVGAPGDGLVASARPADGVLRLQVCNPGALAATVAGPLPYVAFAS